MRTLSETLSSLSRREQILLAVLLCVAVPAALYLLVVRPLSEARARAVTAQQDAAAMQAWVAQADADWQNRQARASLGRPTAIPPPVSLATIERSLAELGLREALSRLEDGENGLLMIGFQSVSYDRLTPLFDRLGPEWGRTIGTMRLDSLGPPGVVTVTMELAPLAR